MLLYADVEKDSYDSYIALDSTQHPATTAQSTLFIAGLNTMHLHNLRTCDDQCGRQNIC